MSEYKKRLVYLLQTKLQMELPEDILHDIDCVIYDTKIATMKMMYDAMEKDKVLYYNEIKLYGNRHKNETIQGICKRLEEGLSIR